ncbi:MAG: hypothetical protein ABSC93_10230 [Bryobacteraceae bacterium]|jgi:hypothetical protein
MQTAPASVAAIVAISLPLAVFAQTTPDKPAGSVRVSGRLVFPDGTPVSFGVRMTPLDSDGSAKDVIVITGLDGRFTFTALTGHKYRIGLADPGRKTPPKTVDTLRRQDIDLGDMIFESCPPITMKFPKPPPAPVLVGDLKLEQIVIEPQQTVDVHRPVPNSPPTDFKPVIAVDPPPCGSGPSLDRRSEWEGFPMVSFDRYLTVESFVGGKVKWIRVVHYDPRLTPPQIRDEVRRVWLGVFWFAAGGIIWSEANLWNLEASVEYEDGKRSSVTMDGGIHVQVQDREGKYWFLRLWPAVQ